MIATTCSKIHYPVIHANVVSLTSLFLKHGLLFPYLNNTVSPLSPSPLCDSEGTSIEELLFMRNMYIIKQAAGVYLASCFPQSAFGAGLYLFMSTTLLAIIRLLIDYWPFFEEIWLVSFSIIKLHFENCIRENCKPFA